MSNPCQEVWDDTVGQEVPKLETKSMGLLMLILNIFFPGIGSIVSRPLPLPPCAGAPLPRWLPLADCLPLRAGGRAQG